MLGATPLTAILGSGVDPTDHDAMRAFVRTACQHGLALLLIQPGSKAPADMRTPQKRNADDRAAREVAREAGRPDWERVRSASGLALATTDATTVMRYLDRYTQMYSTFSNDDGSGNPCDPFITEPVAVNLAVEVGRSRLVIVDCDTAEQVAEFLAISGAPADLPPTVRTPGKQQPDGTWAHRDGGHYYFTLPEGVELPAEQGSYNLGETGFAVLWHNRYALIPPSTRAEGAYELAGRDYPAPEWIVTEITNRCTARRERMEQRRAESGDNSLGEAIDTWAAAITWDAILEPLGWVPVSADASCGCPLWTAPGEHASPKSATAHDAGCTLGLWSSDVNAPLHIWTDHPGEPFEAWVAGHGSTVTKFQAVALAEYGGDMAATVDALGITPGQVVIEGVSLRNLADGDGLANLAQDTTANLRDYELPQWDEPAPAQSWICVCGEPEAPNVVHRTDGPCYHFEPEQPVERMSLRELAGETPDSEFPNVGASDPATGLYLPQHDGMPRIAPLSFWADAEPPEFIIEGLFEHGGLTALIGSPGAGKSSVALDMICHIATGRSWQGRQVLKTRVLYLPGEGLAGAVQRVLAWCEARGLPPELDLEIGQPIIQLGATREAWAELRAYVARREIGLIVFDTFARMATGIEENSATEVGLAIKRFDQVREMTNCGVMVVHHTGKGANATVARGSSALNGAVDSEVLVVAEDERIPLEDGWARPIRLKVTKQKNAEFDGEWMELLMTNWHDRAPLITGPTGSIDPMQGEILLARPVAEPLIETAVRIRMFADRFTEQGVTRSDIMAGVAMDAFTREGRNAERNWRLKVAEAVDRALRYGLLETLSGTPSGARYIPGGSTVENARALAADEVMVPER